jgi:Flp pilus assembly protein TadB
LGWIDLFRALGSSLIEVFRAELDAFKEEMARSGHYLVRGVSLLAAAFFVLFWTLGAMLFAAGAVLAIWLQPWAAALIVVGVFLLVAVLLAWLGMRRLQRFESPVASFKERLDDHLDWWQHTLLADPKPIDMPPPGGSYPRREAP